MKCVIGYRKKSCDGTVNVCVKHKQTKIQFVEVFNKKEALEVLERNLNPHLRPQIYMLVPVPERKKKVAGWEKTRANCS